MANAKHFDIPEWDDVPDAARGRALDRESFLALLDEEVAGQFARQTELTAVVVPFDLPGDRSELKVLAPPEHPQCSGMGCPEQCLEEWGKHLAQLRTSPRAHWHLCPFELYCAVVPVLWRGRCLAAVKLVCRKRMGRRRFLGKVNHLHALTALFVSGCDKALARWLGAARRRAAAGKVGVRPAPSLKLSEAARGHANEALEYLRKHLHETGLYVEDVADSLAARGKSP